MRQSVSGTVTSHIQNFLHQFPDKVNEICPAPVYNKNKTIFLQAITMLSHSQLQ